MAVEKVHAVFMEHASTSPRLAAISKGPKLMSSMQLDVYKTGSRSPRVVANKARLANMFFLDVEAYGWDAACLTPFQVATWVHSRLAGGTKTAGSLAAVTIKLVHAATDWPTHFSHPIVQGQLKTVTAATREPSVSAKTPSVDLVMRFEKLVSQAETVQQRCVAGLFVL